MTLALSRSTVKKKVEIRVRGRVQGVGFRPFVWLCAQKLGLSGEVFNDPEGVLIRVAGAENAIADLMRALRQNAPPLALVEALELLPFVGQLPQDFRITASRAGRTQTQAAPDAKICEACIMDISDPFNRRYRYPFTTCAHCGPRFSILRSIPCDRANTTMAMFELCDDCAGEYRNPGERRYHALPIACHACGPKARLMRLDGRTDELEQFSMLDDVDAARGLILRGQIVAIKGLGGYQLACDATNEASVTRLRQAKRREGKPFALMARDFSIIRRYARVGEMETAAILSAQGPIMVLDADGPQKLPDAVAPGLNTYGFMFPTTPLHHLILARADRPLVMTSGNLSHDPKIIDDSKALAQFRGVASHALIHDRDIANRVDDSVARVMDGRVRLLRRARGYAPEMTRLPPGFAEAPDLLAMGGDLKSAFCLIKDGQAILSQHQGDLENAATYDDYCKNLQLYADLYSHAPKTFVVDRHPACLASKLGRKRADEERARLIEAQHHHAHLASCLAENARPLSAPKVLGIVLDGLGLGDDNQIWGGEFLLADYLGAQRLATFKPVAMPGGDQASREPWRNLYAHLTAQTSWAQLRRDYPGLPLLDALDAKPCKTLETMIAHGLNAPLASSCGRLFDAMAAALGLGWEPQSYEGEAAMKLEALADPQALRDEGEDAAYPFALPRLEANGLPTIEPADMWRAALRDLARGLPREKIAARFHKGLVNAIVAMAGKLARRPGDRPAFDTIALSGGCFQNRILFEGVAAQLRARDFTVLAHEKFPANDGGLALGQAAIAAARLIRSV